jgi:TonB family protein
MSAAAAMALKPSESRKFARLPIGVPLDVIALRSGVPENLPGRCTDLSEGGVGGMVAGELAAGQQVAIELRLPNVGVPLRARALVRYQGKLRCGFEFVGLPAEQQEMIRYWVHRASPYPIQSENKGKPQASQSSIAEAAIVACPRQSWWLRRFYVPLCTVVLLCFAGWWHWQRSWNELETGVYAAQELPMRVPAETMEKRILSKVNPVYPEEARLAGKQGLVVLDAVIAPDGAVEQVQAVSGDEPLAKAATKAVRLWKYEPYQSSGRAARVETTIAVDFRLN